LAKKSESSPELSASKLSMGASKAQLCSDKNTKNEKIRNFIAIQINKINKHALHK
jgi:hypothetical protein